MSTQGKIQVPTNLLVYAILWEQLVKWDSSQIWNLINLRGTVHMESSSDGVTNPYTSSLKHFPLHIYTEQESK